MGFNGKEFKGSTYIKGQTDRTVEGELEKALVASNIIERKQTNICLFIIASEDFLSKHQFSRSSRVDKYVSAMSILFSLKLPRDTSNSDIKAKLETHLPSDIKVFGKINILMYVFYRCKRCVKDL